MKFNTAQRRVMAESVSAYKPGMTVRFKNGGLTSVEAKIEYVDTIFANALGEYLEAEFRESALEYGLMVLNHRGFAVQRIRARFHEIEA